MIAQSALSFPIEEGYIKYFYVLLSNPLDDMNYCVQQGEADKKSKAATSTTNEFVEAFHKWA